MTVLRRRAEDVIVRLFALWEGKAALAATAEALAAADDAASAKSSKPAVDLNSTVQGGSGSAPQLLSQDNTQPTQPPVKGKAVTHVHYAHGVCKLDALMRLCRVDSYAQPVADVACAPARGTDASRKCAGRPSLGASGVVKESGGSVSRLARRPRFHPRPLL